MFRFASIGLLAYSVIELYPAFFGILVHAWVDENCVAAEFPAEENVAFLMVARIGCSTRAQNLNSTTITYHKKQQMRRTGTAKLPLHYGIAPKWLINRMTELAEQLAS